MNKYLENIHRGPTTMYKTRKYAYLGVQQPRRERENVHMVSKSHVENDSICIEVQTQCRKWCNLHMRRKPIGKLINLHRGTHTIRK